MILNALYFIFISFMAGSAVMALANRTVDDLTAQDRWLKLFTYIVIAVSVINATLAGPTFVLGLFSLVMALGLYELVRSQLHLNTDRPRARHRRVTVFAGSLTIYLAIACATVLLLLQVPGEEVLFIYLVVTVFNGLSQVVGQWVGRTFLYRRISQEKTVEGAVGGILAAIAAAVIMRHLPGFSSLEAVLAAIIMGAASQLGDLLASALKRYTGHQHFGWWLPGHGGALDRFDSFLFAAAAWYLLHHL